MRCLTDIKLVFPRAGGRAKRPGKVVGTRRCQMEGCIGVRLIVRWPDKTTTHPCTKGMRQLTKSEWQIV